jgi:hypothetical protein
MDIEQPMIHIRLYREGGQYVESVDIKKGKRKKEEEMEKKGLGVPDFKKGLGLQESIEVITKHSTKGIHRWPLWLQHGHSRLL